MPVTTSKSAPGKAWRSWATEAGSAAAATTTYRAGQAAPAGSDPTATQNAGPSACRNSMAAPPSAGSSSTSTGILVLLQAISPKDGVCTLKIPSTPPGSSL